MPPDTSTQTPAGAAQIPAGPTECRRRAENLAGTAVNPQEAIQAVAWALLAVVAELAEIRRAMRRSG